MTAPFGGQISDGKLPNWAAGRRGANEDASAQPGLVLSGKVPLRGRTGCEIIRDGLGGTSKMRIQGIVALLVVSLLAASLPAAAQPVDPPAATLRAKIKAKYLEKRDRFLHRTRDLYFAVGCKVLASEAGILPLTSPESYLAFIGDQTVVDTRDERLRQSAKQAGLDRAARPGECDYYRRHPEAAEAARRAAAEASTKH
jgi:hypothetical protein